MIEDSLNTLDHLLRLYMLLRSLWLSLTYSRRVYMYHRVSLFSLIEWTYTLAYR
jgi:hypothetical protein